jgi:glutamate/tyrosine decarboxylase-like PLP-dependent enzyme
VIEKKMALVREKRNLSKLFLNSPVLSSVEPGYLHDLLPKEMPEQPEKWQDIMEDLKTQILPGLTHWQSPHFHAFYPSQTSFPAIIGEMLSAGIGS